MADEFFSRAKLTIDSFKIFFETLKSSRENPLKVSDFNLCIENLTFLEQGLKDIEKLGYTKRSAMESVIAADSQLRELRKAAYQATKLLNTRIECIRLLESNLQSREGQLRAWVAAEEERIESRRHESLAEIERIRTTTMDELSLIRQEREASNDCVEDPGEETDVADDSMGEGLDEVVIISLVREMPSEGEESKDQQMDENKNPNEALCQEIISVCHAMDCEALVAIMRLCLIDCGKLEGMSAMKSALESCPDPFLLVSNCFTEKDVTIEICSFLLENLACYSMDRFFYCKVMSSLQRRATSLGKQWIQNGFPRKILGLRAEAEEEFGLLRSLISTFKIESDFGAPQFAEFLAELSTVELVSTAFWGLTSRSSDKAHCELFLLPWLTLMQPFVFFSCC